MELTRAAFMMRLKSNQIYFHFADHTTVVQTKRDKVSPGIHTDSY